MTTPYVPTSRIERLEMPERISTEGRSLRDLERELERAPLGGEFLDITYADTHRFPPPDFAISAFTKAATGGGMTYTPYRGDAGVRRSVAGHVSRFIGIDLDPDNDVILTPGTQAGLYTALAAIIEPGDKVIIPDPDYITSERSVRYFDADYVSVPLIWEVGQAPRLDLDALRRAVDDGAKLLMFSHPNNPTGAVFEPAHVAEIADVVRDSDTLLLVDELYSRLVYDGAPFAHLIAEPGMKERTITTLGPSKTESLSGYRLGVAVAPPEIVRRMEDVMGIASLRAPAYAQHVLSRWLVDDVEYVDQRILEYQALRDRTVEVLTTMPGVEVRSSGGSAYLFPDLSRLEATDQEVALAMKSQAGLIINPGYQFGARGRFHFRLCFAQDERVWEKALQRMGEVLATFPQRS
jgi:aspartate/methionine/tyrosine aminotransferase